MNRIQAFFKFGFFDAAGQRCGFSVPRRCMRTQMSLHSRHLNFAGKFKPTVADGNQPCAVGGIGEFFDRQRLSGPSAPLDNCGSPILQLPRIRH